MPGGESVPPDAFVATRYALAASYVRADAGVFVLAVSATALPQILADRWLLDGSAIAISGLLSFVQLYVNLLLTYRALDHAGAAPPGYVRADLTEARFGSMFAMGFVSGAAIIAGLILLIVPGLMLLLAWSVATPALVGERLRAIESLGRSWRLTRPALGRVVLLWLPVLLFLGIVGVIGYQIGWFTEVATLAETIVLNILLSAVGTFLPVVATFAYLALREADAE